MIDLRSVSYADAATAFLNDQITAEEYFDLLKLLDAAKVDEAQGAER